MRKSIFLFFILICFSACQEDQQPKPKGYLALDYPSHEYEKVFLNCPFYFEKNKIAEISPAMKKNYCWFNLEYPLLNGTIFITYKPVNGNLEELLIDAQKMPLQHTIKADAIEGKEYIDARNRVFGNFYEVSGDAASQAQFYVTDSTTHFLTGSAYFNAQPNYDSIVPAAAYLKKDIRHLMESVRWGPVGSRQ
jgi:gliding motility-associated lipoprotein GldD